MITQRAAALAAVLTATLGCTATSPTIATAPEQAPAAQAAPVAAPATASGPTVKVDMPDEVTPMTLNAMLAKTTVAPGDTVAVMVGVRLLPGWHTYAVVPPEEPYIQTKFTLEPAAGLAATGDWVSPPPVADSSNPRLKVYESTPEPLVFTHALRVSDTATGEVKVRVNVLYQTCDFSRCLPPAEQKFDLTLKIAAKK